MDANREEFLVFMYDVFDSIPINNDGILWVCKTYVTEYIWSMKNVISESEFVNLLNDLNYLATASYDHVIASDLNNFRRLFSQEDDLVYNKEILFSYISEYMTMAKTVSLKKDNTQEVNIPYGESIEFREEDRAGFFNELLSLYKLIGINKDTIHDAVKEWLNVKIIPKVQKNEMSKDSLVLLADVVDQVEQEYNGSIYRVKDLSALTLIELCKFSSVPWLRYGDIVNYLVNGYKLHLNSSVEFTYNGSTHRGTLLGMQKFNGEQVYIVQSRTLPGEFKTVIVREVIPC